MVTYDAIDRHHSDHRPPKSGTYLSLAALFSPAMRPPLKRCLTASPTVAAEAFGRVNLAHLAEACRSRSVQRNFDWPQPLVLIAICRWHSLRPCQSLLQGVNDVQGCAVRSA